MAFRITTRLSVLGALCSVRRTLALTLFLTTLGTLFAATPVPPQTAAAGVEQTFVVNGLFGSATGDYSAMLADGKALPGWMDFDAGTGTFTFQAPTKEIGEYYQIKVGRKNDPSVEFYLLVTDPGGSCSVDANTDRLGRLLSCNNGQTYLRGHTSTGKYYWTGPDKFKSNDQEPRVSKPGVYFLSGGSGCQSTDIVQVLDDDFGCSGTAKSNTIPTASIESASGTIVGTTVALDGSGSTDADGSIIQHLWSWEGGTAVGSRPTVSLPIGTYDVLLTVTDNTGARSTDRVTIETTDDSPDVAGTTPSADSYWLEAECAAVGTNWEVKSSGNASEGAYVAATRSSTKSVPGDVAANRIRFTVRVDEGGDYNLYARIEALDNLRDSYYVRINNGKWIRWYDGLRRGSGFSWNDMPDRVRLVAGTNTIDFAYREKDTRLDKLYLTQQTGAPKGTGGAASNCDDPDMEDNEVMPDSPSVPSGDEFWLEAECAAVGGKWTTVSDDNDASAGGYVVYRQKAAYDSAPVDKAENRITFTVDAKGGDYKLFARIEAPSNQDDSYWVRVNNGQWYEWSSGIQQGYGFNWNKLPKALKLVDGLNTIDFAYRENGARLDKLHLTRGKNSPKGMGDNDSSCSGNSGGTVATTALWLEAECASVGSGWEYGTSSKASGGNYLSFLGDYYTSRPPYKSTAEVSFDFEVSTSGTYHLFMHLDAPDNGSNSFWVRVDNGSWTRFYKEIGGATLSTKGFQWRQVNHDGQKVSFDLSSGYHTITVANRESGTKLDKLFLTTEEKLPTGMGGSATNCNSTASTAGIMSMMMNGSANSNARSGSAQPTTEATTLPDVPAVQSEIPSVTTVDIYPNPTVDQLNVNLSSDYEGRVLMLITDANGRQVRQLNYDKVDASLTERIQVDQLPAGTYHLRILEGDQQTVKSFIKGR